MCDYVRLLIPINIPTKAVLCQLPCVLMLKRPQKAPTKKKKKYSITKPNSKSQDV